MLAELEATKTMTCRIGLKPESPVHSIMIGGHNFVRVTHKITGYNSATKRSIVNGDVVELTEKELELIALKSKLKVVRRGQGKKAQSTVVTCEGKYFRPQPRDIPVFNLIYVEVIDAKDHPHKEFNRPSFFETHGELLAKVKSKQEELQEAAVKLTAQAKHQEEIKASLQADYEDLDKVKAEIAKERELQSAELAKMKAELAKEREAMAALIEQAKDSKKSKK